MTINWSYTLVGFIVGTCMAYSGVGAGAITTPLLIFLGVGSNTAIGSDLLFALGTKIVAMLTHLQKRTVQFSVLWRLSLGGLPGAIIGVSISAYLHHRYINDINALNGILKIAVAIALLLSATGIILNRKLSADTPARSNHAPTLQLAVIGFFVGICVSITSIGAGSLTLPLLLLVAPSVALRRLVGTDLAFAVVVLVPSLIGHWQLGDVNPGIAASLLIGSIPGVFIGTHFVTRLPERWFRSALAGVLVVVALALLPILPHAKG
ncbi:MAG: sulfite exporter TauE/SafE family protein [Candidatus Eremiobacteraeota bacterium]|nr:sulfite exporter TauE/SafE family protein [Candidatus Eremiobacteraeota bacterium]